MAYKEVIYESSVKRYYRIDRREICYLKSILEGYAGVAIMRTLDPQEGLVVLHVGPGCEMEVDMIINDLQSNMRIEAAEISGKEAL